jgi:hypothetical protein
MNAVISALEQERADEDEMPGSLSDSFLRLPTGCTWGIAVAMLVVIAVPFSAIHAEIAQSSTSPKPAGQVVARPCKSIPVGSKRSKGAHKDISQKLGNASGNATNACIEVHSTAIEVQEYLQAQGREGKWNLSDEHVAEDAWTFSRKLERDELLRFTKPDASTDRVNWTSGAAFVQVSTVELDDGFVRVEISAHFEGYGQSADRFAPPKGSWPLNSNATLESHLLSILGKHFKNAS